MPKNKENIKTRVELLAPAKNLQFGLAAINHGADAVYIGVDKFGARSAAGNPLSDVESLVHYAHVYNAKVYVTLNTVLFDNELEQVRNVINNLYEMGVDAIIIQDMAILQMDLPPVNIHASTQMHNISVDKIKFYEKCGLKRVILPREFSLNDIIDIRKNTSIELETFVHGALCVCYSGQCYLSLAINGRSGNRGECSQPCRSKYNLLNDKKEILIANQHLLSLRDLNASQYLQLYAMNGVNSFKIEGRLKDISYLKNITAYYRQIIDNMGVVGKTSSGNTTFFFTPDPEKTFNRGYTSYMIEGQRAQMASFYTPKSIGKKIGKVIAVYDNAIRVDVTEKLNSGDGICFFSNDQLDGFLVNRFENNIITSNKPLKIKKGIVLYRNYDKEFEKLLEKDATAERKIDVDVTFRAVDDGFELEMVDSDNCSCSVAVECEKIAANNTEKSVAMIKQQLAKFGATPFKLSKLNDETCGKYFLQSSMINELRRKAVDSLIEIRRNTFRHKGEPINKEDVAYPCAEVDYRANITNKLSAEFYMNHHVDEYELGLDVTNDFKNKVLMTTKYCLRYEIGQCLKSKNVDDDYKGKLFLENNGNVFELRFDCKNCEMQVVGSVLK